MYKILIVEDEYFVRKGLRTVIDYEALNCIIVDEAKNGAEALELLNNNNIDIVITDVKMPVLDGIELVKKAQNKNVVFIILSGFDEFHYAQQAIRLGVSSYLLKPIEEKELISALEKAKHDLNIRNLYHKIDDEINEISSINLLSALDNSTLDSLVEKMLEYIRENYDKKFTMEDLTKDLHYSESTLNSRFKNATGTTFNTFLNQYRIQKSMELIDEGVEVSEIYSHVGFNDNKYFRIVFEKYTGISPSLYKKSK